MKQRGRKKGHEPSEWIKLVNFYKRKIEEAGEAKGREAVKLACQKAKPIYRQRKYARAKKDNNQLFS